MNDEKRGARRGAETRGALLRATAAIIERDGIDKVTIRRVAEEASLPTGTVHYWFADKEELLSAALHELLRVIREDVDATADDESVEHRLSQAHARFIGMPKGRQLALFELTTFAARSEDLQGLARAQYEAYTDAARVALEPWSTQAERALPGGVDALAALTVAVIDGLTLAELANPGDPSRRAALELFTRLVDEGLADR